MQNFDCIVIGAGIAGASIAAHLAENRSVCLVEMEDRPGFHTTGRSAASYEPNYGPAPMLAFTRASEKFFKSPPPGFSDAPLFTKRSSMFFEADGQEKFTAKLLSQGAGLEEISYAAAKIRYPVLRDGYAQRVFFDASTGDLDVDLIHRGYLKLFKHQGGNLLLSQPVQSLQRHANHWQIQCTSEKLNAPLVINAAGAWGDVVAGLAGVKPVGLIPKRRSIGIIPYQSTEAFDHWPMVTDVGETWYSKPQSGKLIVSSADATPVEPHDAYADDMAIAEGVDRLMTATTIAVERLDHSWGGLRTFAPDGMPVVGFDPHTEGFFWLVGQGGYGIQSSPALSEAAAALAMGKAIPQRVLDLGLEIAHIRPERLRS